MTVWSRGNRLYGIQHPEELNRSTNERTQGILDFQVPKTKKQLRGFLGTINYDRMFVVWLSSLVKPLYDALNT